MADPTANYRVIDLTAKKTEAEWGRAIQARWERATAAWFTWVGWPLACGALAYHTVMTRSLAMAFLALVSELLLWQYFVWFFGSIIIEPYMTRLAQSRTRRATILMILLITVVSAIPAYGVHLLIDHVIDVLKATHG